jgi:hypothetical protein
MLGTNFKEMTLLVYTDVFSNMLSMIYLLCIYHVLITHFSLFLVVLGFELKDLLLLGRCSNTWAISLALLFLLFYSPYLSTTQNIRVMNTLHKNQLWPFCSLICDNFIFYYLSQENTTRSLSRILKDFFPEKHQQCFSDSF